MASKKKAETKDAPTPTGDPPEGAGPPDWLGGPEITESQLAFLTLRRGFEDAERVLKALKENGNLAVVPDP